LRLIFVFAVIQDLAHRRLGIGSDLHQIESGFNRARECLGRGNHADIVAGSVDELDVGNVDALVDARAALFGGKLRRPSYDVAFSSVGAAASPHFVRRRRPSLTLSCLSATGWEMALKSQAARVKP